MKLKKNLDNLVSDVITSRYWLFLTKSQIRITIFLFLSAFFFNFPSYDVVLELHEFDDHWQAFFLQTDHPFTNHNDLYEKGSHQEKMAFRFIPALMVGILGVKSIAAVLIFQILNVFFFYRVLVSVLFSFFRDSSKTLLVGLTIVFLVCGNTFISDIRAMFDTLALLFLLLALHFRKSPWSGLFLLMAFFTDERALVASPAIALFLIYDDRNLSNSKTWKFLLTKPLILYCSWVVYFFVRFTLSELFDLFTGSVPITHLERQVFWFPYVMYIGFEGFIILLAAVLWRLWKEGYLLFLLGIIFVFTLTLLIALSVIDIWRSMAYNVLIIILVGILFERYFTREQFYRALIISMAISIPFTNTIPFILQVYRMIFITGTL